MKKTKINLPVKLGLTVAAIVVASALILAYLASALRNSGYFKIKEIASNRPEEGFDFTYLSGRNIFDIDLNKESRYICELYPVFKSIRLFRVLPNRLFVAFTDRKPVACVKLYRNFCVDDEEVLFDLPQGAGMEGLPVIIGLERKISGPRPGRQYNIKELATALNIIKGMDSHAPLRKYRLVRIDVTNPSNISCFVQVQEHSGAQSTKGSRLLEVKVPQEDIGAKVRVLSGLFSQLEQDISKIKYIDLRFKEPVVKFRDAS